MLGVGCGCPPLVTLRHKDNCRAFALCGFDLVKRVPKRGRHSGGESIAIRVNNDGKKGNKKIEIKARGIIWHE